MDDQKPLKTLFNKKLKALIITGNVSRYRNYTNGNFVVMPGEEAFVPEESLFFPEDSSLIPDKHWDIPIFRGNGPYLIADTLRQINVETDVLDYIHLWSLAQFNRWLKYKGDVSYDIIGMSHTFASSYEMRERLDFFKKIWPDAVYITGALNTLHEVGFDYYIKGFGEAATKEIIESHFYGKKGLKWTPFGKGKLVDANTFYTTHFNKDYSYTLYEEDLWDENYAVPTIEFSRGCKFACKFCDFPLIGMKEDTGATEESIYRFLMTNYEQYGKTQYIVGDDTINNNMNQLITLKNAVSRLPFKPEFSGFVRVDLIRTHPETKELLCEAGLTRHTYGIETLNHRTGKIIGKGLHPEKVLELLSDIKDYFEKNNHKRYGCTSHFIYGLPYETQEDFERNTDRLVEIYKDNPNCHMSVAGLMLTKNVNPDGVNQHLSAFGENMEKYGYFPMSEKEFVDKLESLGIGDKVIKQAVHHYYYDPHSHITAWKSSVTDVISANKFTHELHIKRVANGMVEGPNAWFQMLYDYNTCTPIVNTKEDTQRYINRKILDAAMNR